MRTYLDAPPVIYYVERTPDFFAASETWIADPENVLIASDLTRMECRVTPVRNSNSILLTGFDQFFE